MAYNIMLLPLLISVSTKLTFQPTPPAPTPSIDPNTLIGGGVAIITALIAGSFVVYQTRANRKLQREMLELQQKLADQDKAKEKEEQRKVETEQFRKEQANAQQRATELTNKLNDYRYKFLHDSNISELQILRMNRPLEVNSIYIRVRLHGEVQPRYEIDSTLVEAEKTHDPNILLTASRKYLKQKISQSLDPSNALLQYRRCVILGDPGAGKTTLLKYLALQAVQGKLDGLPNLPIHVSLNEFVTKTTQANPKRDLIDFAAYTWETRYQYSKEDAYASIQKAFSEGKALLLLDALDETVTGSTAQEAEATYTQIVQIINDIKTAYPQIPIVVTARKAGYYARPRLSGFMELEVLDFTQDDIEQFIKNWFACYHSTLQYGNTEDLIMQLRNNSRIQALAANPLLLSLIVLVYQAQLDLPDRRAELYKECIDLLLKEWDSQRGIRRKREFKPEYKLLLLEELAWHFHQQGQRYFPDREVLSQISQFLPAVGIPSEQCEAILEEIANENGLLKEQAQGWHGFLHLTLQEYFVARRVNHNYFENLFKHRYDPWWEEVFLLYAGQTPDASTLLEKLLEQEHLLELGESLFHRDLLLAGKCLAARPVIRKTFLRHNIIEELFNKISTIQYSSLHNNILSILATIGEIDINNKLIALLFNVKIDVDVRSQIALALGISGERSIAPQLVSLLSDEKIDTFVRGNIARALGTLGERSIISQLVSLLSNEKIENDVRGNIARALGTLGERSIAPQLVSLLSDKKIDVFIRSSIVIALGTLGERSIAPQLVSLLSDKKIETIIRNSIARALGTLGERSIAPQLVSLLSDDNLNTNVRAGIARALGTLGERSIIPQLVSLLSDNNLNTNVRNSIASALGTLGERSIAPQLVSLLSDDNLNIRDQDSITNALGTLGERSIIPQLVSLLSDDNLNTNVRAGIANALGTLGERSIIPQLVSLLSDNNLNIRMRNNIASTLGTLGERSIAPQLVSLLSDEKTDTFTRMRIANTLRTLGERSIAPQLVSLLSDEKINVRVRSSIARALGTLVEDIASIQHLTQLLWSQHTRQLVDQIYTSLREASSQLHINIYIKGDTSEEQGRQIRILSWNN